MGRAFGLGLRTAQPKVELNIFDIDQHRAAHTSGECAGTALTSVKELCVKSDTLLLAIKPQHAESLFSEIGESGAGKKYISIMAGTPISYLESYLPKSQIVRFMPNLAATVGASVVGISCSSSCDSSFRKDAFSIASAVGIPMELPENLLSAITGLSGSGLAYVFAFLHAMALGGTDAGFSYEQALEIAYGTVEGAVKLLRKEGVGPSEYLTRVTSAGGTTIRGVKALEKEGFTHAVMEAIAAAADRADEIEAAKR